MQRFSQVVAYFELKYDTSSGEEIFPAISDYKKQRVQENLSARPKIFFDEEIVFEGAIIGVQFDHAKINNI